jgi:hypothetical protein
MKYCKNCGKEVDDHVEFCQTCGYHIQEDAVIYRKPKNGSTTAVKVLAVLFGGLLLIIGVPLIFAGTVVTGINQGLVDNEGYIGIRGIDFATHTQALVFKDIDIDEVVDEELDVQGFEFWGPSPGDFVKIRINVESNNLKDVFIGITRESNALDYIGTSRYSSVTQFTLEGPEDKRPIIRYQTHPGQNITVEPKTLDIWEIYQTGNDVTLTWEPTYGDYWVVIMNNDLSTDVDVETGIGVKVPFLGVIGTGLIIGGLICAGIGVTIIYLGVIRRVD